MKPIRLRFDSPTLALEFLNNVKRDHPDMVCLPIAGTKVSLRGDEEWTVILLDRSGAERARIEV